MLPLSLSVPIIGALSLRQALNLVELIVLAGIGINAHFFGFVLNDLIDYALDKNSPFRQRSPLVRGEIKRWRAWLFVLVQIPIAFVLYKVVLNGHSSGLIWLAISVSLGIIYNLFSKWRWLPRILAELSLALSVMFLSISGASAFESNLPHQTFLFCGTLGLVLLLVNSVASGLKDIQFDSMFGARSFVLSAGTTVSRDGELTLSPLLKRYMVGLQLSITLLALILSMQYQIGIFVWIVLIILQAFAILHTLRLLQIQHIDEFPKVFLFLGGYYNYLVLVLLVWAYLPPLLQIIIGMLIIALLTIPFRRAWSTYRQRHKTILS